MIEVFIGNRSKCQCWPECRIDDDLGEVRGAGTEVHQLLHRMLKDEDAFNDAIETCPQTYDHLHPEMQYRLQMEKALGSVFQDDNVTLQSALRILKDELIQKWELAWNIRDHELQGLLGCARPRFLEETPPPGTGPSRW